MLTVTATFVLELSPQTAHFEQNCANVSRSQSLCFRMAIKGSVYSWGPLARILSLFDSENLKSINCLQTVEPVSGVGRLRWLHSLSGRWLLMVFWSTKEETRGS